MTKSIKTAPTSLTDYQKQKYIEVQNYIKEHGVSKTKAMVACKASPTVYYPAEKYFNKHGNLGTKSVTNTPTRTAQPGRKRKYTKKVKSKKAATPRTPRRSKPVMETLEVDAPVQSSQQMVALIGNPTDIMQSLKNLFS